MTSLQASIVNPIVYLLLGVVLVVLFGPVVALVIVVFGNVVMAGGMSALTGICRIYSLPKAAG